MSAGYIVDQDGKFQVVVDGEFSALRIADDGWIGLGAAKGRIDFDDQAVDEINFLDCNVGIGIDSPVELLHLRKDVNSKTLFKVENQQAGTGAYTGVEFVSDSSQGGFYVFAAGFSDAEYADKVVLKAESIAVALMFESEGSGSIEFYIGGHAANNKKVIFDSNGNVGIGASTFGTNAAGTMAFLLGTDPDGEVTNQFAFWGKDFAAGNTCPYFRTENGTVIGLNQSLLTTNKPTFAGALLTDDLTLSKTSGKGIKIDTGTPTFGWRDLLGQIRTRGVGSDDPTDATYNGNIKAYKFAVGDECWVDYHIPHDYVLGTDIFLHFHWSHNSGAVTGGSVTWGADITYAKGHDQAAFPASVNTTVVGNASTTQYQHIITEIQVSASAPSGSQIDTDDLEPDGVIMIRGYLSANNMAGATPDPFLHFKDIHYQSTNIATKNKVPDFYS